MFTLFSGADDEFMCAQPMYKSRLTERLLGEQTIFHNVLTRTYGVGCEKISRGVHHTQLSRFPESYDYLWKVSFSYLQYYHN